MYGGTFDPVHLGHLEIARRVCELFEIDQVFFVPAQVAPHKVGRPISPSFHRYAMLVLATQGDESLLVSTFELDKPDRSFTVDTLAHYRASLGSSTDLFFVMGADSWSEITTWRDWERLLTMINHIVVTRPGFEPSRSHVGALGERVFFTDAVMMDVSATNIRRMASEERYEDLAWLLPGPVLKYIEKYKIYRELNEAKLNS